MTSSGSTLRSERQVDLSVRAARLKAEHRNSLADAIVAAFASRREAGRWRRGRPRTTAW